MWYVSAKLPFIHVSDEYSGPVARAFTKGEFVFYQHAALNLKKFMLTAESKTNIIARESTFHLVKLYKDS